ncbi:septum formation initiator family protein [uncultured Clostridium sp.]|uniref:FtsB family cell division protein n=1 Tax=uncultured Clostridium sp. TaxID=59620 RepID=UPI0025D22ABF|nr:septum formation initiator family protein [uncultured Clostridium sp.]
MKKKLIIKKLIIFAFVIFFIGSYINQLVTTRRIENEIAVKQAQLEEVQEKNERLQEEVEKINSGSADYLERLARERLGMIKPGEKVVNSSNNEKESNPN